MDLRWDGFDLVWLQNSVTSSIGRDPGIEDGYFPDILFLINRRHIPSLLGTLLPCFSTSSDQIFLYNGSVKFVLVGMHEFSTYKLWPSQFLHPLKMLSWLWVRGQVRSSFKMSFFICRARLTLPWNCASRFVILNVKLHSGRVPHRRNDFTGYNEFCRDSFCTLLEQFLVILRRLLTGCMSFLHRHFFMKSLRSFISDLVILLRYFVLLMELYGWHAPVPLVRNWISLFLSHILCCIHGRSSGLRLLLRLLSCWFLALRYFLICPVSVQFVFNRDKLCCIKSSSLFRSIFSAHFW